MRATSLTTHLVSGMLGGLLALSGSMIAQAQRDASETIRTQNIELVNPNGKTVGFWRSATYGSTLSLNDGMDGTVTISSTEKGRSVILKSLLDELAIVSDDNGSRVKISKQNESTEMSILRNCPPSIKVTGDLGTVTVSDDHHYRRAVMGTCNWLDRKTDKLIVRPHSSLALFDSKGEPQWHAP